MKTNWDLVNIEKICEIGDGNHGGNYPQKSDMRDSGVPFIRSVNLVGGIVSDQNMRFISHEKHASLRKGHLKTGDVLFTNRGDIGKSAVVDKRFDDANLNSQIAFFRPSEKILSWYLYYILQSPILQNYARKITTGAALQQLPIGKIIGIKIPLPPLPEQQRIVDILDQSFEAIDQAIENTAINKGYSKEIYEAFIDNIFDSLLKICPTKKLNDICIIRPPKNEVKEKLNESSMVSFAPMEDLGINQKFMIPEKEKKLIDVYSGYTYFAENDVLLAKITPCFENGKLGIAKNLINEIGFGSSEYIVFRPSEELRPEFLYYFLSREKFRNEGIKHMQGAVGHKRVSLEFVSNYLIPVPSLEQQDEIIDKIDMFFNQTNSLRINYEMKIDNLQELKQSILHKAFNGEL